MMSERIGDNVTKTVRRSTNHLRSVSQDRFKSENISGRACRGAIDRKVETELYENTESGLISRYAI
jgi:hypothetical protein